METNRIFLLSFVFGFIALECAMAQIPSGSDSMKKFDGPIIRGILPPKILAPVPVVKAPSGRYRVVMTGFTAQHETWDHAGEVDGKRDEVFVKSEVYELNNGNQVLPKATPRSYTFGDVYRISDLNRWRVGTASGLGGIMTGDSYPFPPSPLPGCSTNPNHADPSNLPMELWAGELVQGQNAVTIIPTIWEYDGGQDIYREWVDWAKKTTTKLADNKAFTKLIGSTGDTILSLTGLGLDVALSLSDDGILGNAKDRPIGMVLKAGSDKEYEFNPYVIKLTYETIESALKGETRFGGYPSGVIPLAYTDDSRLQGDYTIFIKIERDVPFPPPSVWSTCPVGRFQTPDGDVIDYLIENGMSATSDTIEFVLALGPNVTWKKILNLPDGQGSNWNIEAEGAGLKAIARNSLWAHQVKNGQNLTFTKAKEFGRMVDVLKVGDIQGITPGSRITFTWRKD